MKFLIDAEEDPVISLLVDDFVGDRKIDWVAEANAIVRWQEEFNEMVKKNEI
jgi:hypothetical protein